MTAPFRTLMSLCFAALAVTLETGPATAACGCVQMTIRTADSPQTLCSNRDLNFPECGRRESHGTGPCAAFTYQYDCPVGSKVITSTLESRYGFVAESQLAAGSTLGECEKGQALQLTITSDQSVDKPLIAYANPRGLITIGATTFFGQPSDGIMKYPDVGTTNAAGQPFYGSDNYSDPASLDHLIQWSAPTLKWWDNPDQLKDDPAERAHWQYRFVSFVKGSPAQGSCVCFFDIDVDWGTPHSAAPVTRLSGPLAGSVNCILN